MTLDTVAPTVTIDQAAGQSDPTNAGQLRFTVVFSEAVTDFVPGDVALSGTAGGDRTVTVTGSGTTYEVTVSGQTDGTVIASIPAGAAVDAAQNTSAASTSTDNTMTYDGTAPSVTIDQAAGQADPSATSPVTFTVVFSEPVTGFTADDVSLSGTATRGTPTVTGSGTTYTVSVPVTTDGTVTATVTAGKAIDAVGNANTASTSTDNTVTVDVTAPTVTINQAAGQSDPSATSPVTFTVVFSEPVTGFTADDVSLSGTATRGTPTVTGSGTTYTVSVPVTSDGTVTATVPAGKATDAVGNANTASTSTDNTITYDATAPAYTSVSASGGSPVVIASFSEPILCSTVATTDFDATVGGIPATVDAIGCSTTSDATIEVTLGTAPTHGQTVVLRLKGSVTDPAGNAAAFPVSRSATAADATPPTFLSISAANASATVTASFDEALLCSSVSAADFTATSSTGGSQTPRTVVNATCSGSTVTLTLSAPVFSGMTVTVTLVGSVSDTAGNATTQQTARSTTV